MKKNKQDKKQTLPKEYHRYQLNCIHIVYSFLLIFWQNCLVTLRNTNVETLLFTINNY